MSKNLTSEASRDSRKAQALPVDDLSVENLPIGTSPAATSHPLPSAPDKPTDKHATNPTAKLLLVDVAMLVGSFLLRHSVERAFLRGHEDQAPVEEEAVKKSSVPRTLASAAVARFGAKSVPGVALVATGIGAKWLYERSKARRMAQSRGQSGGHLQLPNNSAKD